MNLFLDYQKEIFTSLKILEKNLTEFAGSDKGKLVPTDIGSIVNDFLVSNFESILDFNFTIRNSSFT